MLTAALTLSACGGPSTRASVCGAYDDLGKQTISPHPLSDNVIFRKARELGNEAGRYDDSSAVKGEADGLKKIGKSDSTAPAELTSATTAIARLCGHPLGIGSTQPRSTTDGPAQTNTTAEPDGGAGGGESDEDQIRAVMRQWGAATDPAEMCSLETPAAQKTEIDKSSGASSCEDAMDTGTPREYSSIDVTRTGATMARVEVEGSDITSYLLLKVGGAWKIEKYGTHLDLPSPDAGPCDPGYDCG